MEIDGIELKLIENPYERTCTYCFFGGYDDGDSKYCCLNYETDCNGKRNVYIEED